MENNPNPLPKSDEAHHTLDALDTDRARLAEHIVTPWWYHPIYGFLVAVIICGVALPGLTMFYVLFLASTGLLLLAKAYARLNGVWITQAAGPHTRRLLNTMMAIVMAAGGVAAVIRFTDAPFWWVFLPAGGALVTAVFLGRHYDDVLRAELSASEAQA